jgi:hypothetical protein
MAKVADNKQKKSFWERIIDFFSGQGNVEREKRRFLKGVEDQLRKRSKYYRLNSQELTPAMGKFFFDIYSVVAPASILLQNLAKSEQLKNIVIELGLDENRRKIINELTPESLKRRSNEQNIDEVQEAIKREVRTVIDFLSNSTTSSRINLNYTYIRAFSDFISFDFYHFVKEFDASLPEKNLKYRPKLGNAPVGMLIKDLEDFLNISQPIINEVDWDRIFDVLKDYRNTELINREAWRKVVTSIREMLKSETIELILKVINKDPFFEIKPTLNSVDIVKPYVSRLRTRIDGYVRQLGQLEKNKALYKVVKEAFGNESVPVMLINYSQLKNTQLFTSHEQHPNFIYTEVVNAIVAFGETYLKKEIKILVDLLLLKGKWSQNVLYKDFSQSFQELIKNCDDISSFDDDLGEESSTMMRLRSSLRASERDKFAANNIKAIVEDINDDARKLLQTASQNYVIFGRSLKTYIDDYKLQPKSEIIINWKEVEKDAERPLGRFMADAYTRIYYLIQMFQQYGREG